jgi:hypothetical protein
VSCIAGVLRALHVARTLGETADWPFLDDYGVAALDADIWGVGNHLGGRLHGLGALTVGARPPVLGQSPAEDEVLVVALRALLTISPSIHDDELRKRVDAFISATYGFRVKTVDFEIVQEPFAAARERLTEVYKKLG